jgi:hypothetical protein
VQGNKLFCATENSVFSITENELERYTKINGLSEVLVASIAWDDFTNSLIVGYKNGNIDIITNNIIANIDAIATSNIVASKTIHSIFCKNGLAYINTNFGIVLLNIAKKEIKDTWLVGTNNSFANCYSLAICNDTFYIATQQGTKKAASNSNLNNSNNWYFLNVNNSPSLYCIANNNSVFYTQNDSVFSYKNGITSFVYTSFGYTIQSITINNNQLIICQTGNNVASKVVQLNITNNVIVKTLLAKNSIDYPKNAILVDADIWVADLYNGLSKNGIEMYVPNGPIGGATGQMIVANETLFVAAGGVNNNWNYQYNRNGIYKYKNNFWQYDGYYNQAILDSVLDFVALAYNNKNASLWAASYGGGLVSFDANNKISIFKKNNSTLQPAIGDSTSTRVSGLCFDDDNNLWIANYGASKCLSVLTNTNKFIAFEIPFLLSQNAVSFIEKGSNNLLWIISPNNGLICFDKGKNIEDTNDDKWKMFTQANGNLPSNKVLCIAKDNNESIFIGTDNGVAFINCSNQTFATSCQARLPIVKNGSFIGNLLKGETINTIAVDGANRKWIGTQNGAFLVAPDGDEILETYTTSNSTLLGNDVYKIAINPTNGEIFFATNLGICSLLGTATQPKLTNENSKILVFPNPVPPNFNGTIAIRGLEENSIVKITDVNGNIVHQTKSLGGQAIWNGLSLKNTKVAAGIYLIFIKNLFLNSEAMVGKIAILQ